MRFLHLLLLATLLTASCAERGTLQFAPADDVGTVRNIWTVNFRSDIQATSQGAPPRPEEVRYQKLDVSIPPTHQIGQIEWPRGEPDTRTDFVTVGQADFETPASFAQAVARSDVNRQNETLVFVHGYNTRHAEAVYQMAQIAEDFAFPMPVVLFSWPSAGVTAGYVYDRDSVLMSRDLLEQTIIDLSRNSNRKVVLMAHSMGSQLVMETLRQIELKGSLDISNNIGGVVLMAPDIDSDVFRAQAQSISKLPQPFILMVAEQDRALRISSLLTGRRPRLGAQTDRSTVGDLPISVIDVSDLTTGKDFEHKITTTSPAAISILRRLSEETPPGEANIGELVVLSELPN